MPLHTPDDWGGCDCGKRQDCPKPGKHPRTTHGVDDATTNEDTIQRWWSQFPTANVGVDLKGANLLDIAPDSIEWQAEFIARGLPLTPSFRSGGGEGHEHHLYRRPDVCPTHRLCRADEYDILSAGYAVMPPSRHASGTTYAWKIEPDGAQLAKAPIWAVRMQRDAAKGSSEAPGDLEPLDSSEPPVALSSDDLALWHGELIKLKPGGSVDRSMSLWNIGCALARAGATRSTIARALQNRDEQLGWSKYTGRRDASTRYLLIADRALSGTSPRIRLSPPSTNGVAHDVPGELTEEETWTWRVYDIAEFMSLQIPAVQWLIDRIMREQAIVGNFGGPGTLKTYFMTQLALSLASGKYFLDVFETQRARVLIVEEDTLEADYQQAYLAPMLKAMQLDPADLRSWLFIAPAADLLLDQPDRLAALEERIAALKPVLVCLDAFYLLHTGEGMTAKDLQPILATLKRLRRKYGCGFWIIDHNRKSSGSIATDESAIDRWYGGRSKSAASDEVIETRARKDDDGAASFHFLKLRGAKLPKPINVRLVDGKLVIDDNESDQASEETQRKIIDWLATQMSGRTINDMVLGTRLSHRHAQRACAGLAAAGQIQKTGKAGRADLWSLSSAAGVTAGDLPWGEPQ